jgi:hypothetical protein
MLRRNPRVTPFAHFLVGGARGTGDIDLLDVHEASTEFGYQAGAGIDFWMHPRFGVRIGGDHRHIYIDEGANEYRAQIGIVVGVGQR